METIIELLSVTPWWKYISAAVTIASIVTALTPTPQEGTIISKIYKIIECLALNVGRAKDKAAPAAAPEPSKSA